MANAFQDQFVKAGLVDKNKLNKVKRVKHKNTKQQGKNQAVDKNKQRVQQALLEKTEHDRELNRQKEDKAQHKAIAAQIKQLIQLNRLEYGEGDIGFKFSDNNVIKTLYVPEPIQQQLSDGRLAIVRIDTQYAVVPRVVADKIRLRDAGCILLCHDQKADTQSDDDGSYANYKIPDDLMW